MREVGTSKSRTRRAGKFILVTATLVAAVAIVLGSFLFGFVVNRKQIPPYQIIISTYYGLMQHDFIFGFRQWLVGEAPPDGGWHVRKSERSDLSALQEEEMRQLAALGYVSGVRRRKAESGVTIFEADSAFEGSNLYCSGHGPEATLMEMDGTVLHRWRLPFGEAFPDVPIHPNDERPDFWRKIHLYKNGDLLAIFDGLGIVKMDKNSNRIWSNPNSSHHDLGVHDNGEIYVLTRTPRLIPEVDERHPYWRTSLRSWVPTVTNVADIRFSKRSGPRIFRH